VSGIVAGIAPDAKIVAAKALGKNGTGYESDIIAAIDYCIANKDLYQISVILLALGGGSFDGYCDAVLVTDESNYAVQQGMFVVAASGNDHSSNLTAPACGTNVTSVAATTKNDTFYPDNNINPLLDVLAPGVNITSTKLGGGFRIGSGTSASAAVVAGAAALILENESLEPLELQYRFRSTGVTMTHQGNNYTRIDAYNAINNIVTNTPSEQVGNQTNGTWKEYCPASRYCTCYDYNECGSWEYCHEYPDCINEFYGECEGCLGLGASCAGEGDPACCPQQGRYCTYS
jgi:subtilisin family serine protease